MSLGKLSSKVKSGATALTSTSGMKNTAMNLAIGAGIGAIAALILHALQLFVINKYLAKYSKISGFSIYPNSADNAIYVEDILLILISASMLFSKKLWLTVGFILGWYGSNYMGFYTALGLPQPTPP